ncbi:chymotrypsin-2-like [Onthophagus taurus]|uniref:chymotrypsin-2-like n=1 Tax=Onthophagus taurus TaxID=166361 RepID=UPI0039BE24BF
MYIIKFYLLFLFLILTESKKIRRRKKVRIIEGEVANQKDYPFVVSIIYNNRHICGGSLISERYVLTAAHCTYSGSEPRNIENILISVGSSKWETGTKYEISKSYAHEDYDKATTTNDIGLFKTEEDVEFTQNVQPIKLYLNDLPKESDLECMVIGWGFTSDNGFMVRKASSVLNLVKIKTISIESCRKFYRHIDERNICLTGSSRKGTCSGDSGGPLFIQVYTELMQIGLVSFGGDCNNTSPEVHTRIFYFKDWISYAMTLLDVD